MDALDRLAAPGGDLLGRVDHLLATVGAPADHRVWPLLRRLRALPGEAAAAIVALRPDPFTAAGTEVRELLADYTAIRTGLSGDVAWEGVAGSAFDAHRKALVAYLDEGPESMRGRLVTTAEYADAVAGWVVETRLALARTLAEVLGSAEAALVVTASVPSVVTAPPMPADRPAETAAAEIGARVLATVATAYDGAEALLARWRPAVAELLCRPPAEDFVALDAGLRISR